MLGGLVSDIAPADFVEWLWLIDFLDCAWKFCAIRRYRAIVIESAPSGSVLQHS